MIAGVRLSEIAVGEPILGISWEYKELTGKDAVIKRLEDQFYNASYLGFKYVIDTIRPMIDANGRLTMQNNGVFGDIWTFEERMDEYRRLSSSEKISVLLELEFTVQVTDANVDEYIRFIISDLIARYQWVKYWQIGYLPDKKYDNGTYNCSPKHYVYIMKSIYQKVKMIDSTIHIGGPGIFESLANYLDNRSGWLNEAIGNRYNESQEFVPIGPNGFLEYIDFFTFHGRQDTQQFAYNNYTSVVDNIRTMIYEHLGGNSILIFSTLQGHKANQLDGNALKQQSYYDIREILKAIKCGVVPFKNELVDAYPDPAAYNGKYDASRIDYGILYWYMVSKPAFNTYKFIFDACANFSHVHKDSQVYEENENIDSITFQREEEGSVYNVTVLWPTTYSNESVVLLPANYLREYQIENGTRHTLTESVQIDLKDTKFVVVYEHIELLTVDVDDITKNIERRLRYQREIHDQMVEELPSSFNKECTDTNFYKLMRAVAVEMADASMTLTMIKEDMYIDTARDEAIYGNFGVLIKLQKQADWSYEKYRRLVKGVTNSLLQGPTYQSVTDALQLFTNFKVSIGELYKESDRNKYDASVQQLNPRFSFVVELEKPVEDDTYTQEELMNDCAYVLKLVKPAHTIGQLIIVLAGSENWQSYYGDKYKINWHDMDDSGFSADMNKIMSEGIFGWKHVDYTGNYYNGITTNMPLLNNGLLVGPRYVLYDRSNIDTTSSFEEDHTLHDNIEESLAYFLGKSAYEEYKNAKDNLHEITTYNAEPRFGFYNNKYLRLTGGRKKDKILNQYMLSGKSHLKDEHLVDANVFFREMYIFSNTLNVIRFSNNYGFSARFINQNNVVTVWEEYLKEHSFKEIVTTLPDGTTKTIQRLQTKLGTEIEGYREDFDKSSIQETEIIDRAFEEQVLIPDDPLTQFTNNITPLNRHKLGPNRREKIWYGEFISDVYDKADDYLGHVFNPELFDKYNFTIEEQNELDNQSYNYDEYDHFRQEEKDYFRLNNPDDKVYTLEYDSNTINLLRTFIPGRFEQLNAAIDKIEETFIPKKDELDNSIDIITNERMDKPKEKRQEIKENLKDQYILNDDNTHALAMNRPFFNVSRFVKKQVAIPSFNVLTKEQQFKQPDELFNYNGVFTSNDIIDKPKELLTTKTYFADRFYVYDDEATDTFILNKRNGRFIKHRTNKISFGPTLFDNYQFSINDVINFYRESYNNETYKKPDELPEFKSGFSDRFILYDDENEELIKLNRQLTGKKFIKHKTSKYAFNPQVNDTYNFDITDNEEHNVENISTEQFISPEELPEFISGFNEKYPIKNIFTRKLRSIQTGAFDSVYGLGMYQKDSYQFDIKDGYDYSSEHVLTDKFKTPSMLPIVEMGMFSEVMKVGRYNLLLNKTPLNNSILGYIDWDHIMNMDIWRRDAYKFPIYDKNSKQVISTNEETFEVKEETNENNINSYTDEDVSWRYTSKPFKFIQGQFNKTGFNPEQDLSKQKIKSKYIEDVPKPEVINIIDFNKVVKDKFKAPVEDNPVTIREYKEKYYNLNKDKNNFQFNGMTLNAGTFYQEPNEKRKLEVMVFDKYHPMVIDKELPREVCYSDDMTKPGELNTVEKDYHEHHKITPNVINPFKFSISQFTKHKFMRKNVIDLDTYEWGHVEEKFEPPTELPESTRYEKENIKVINSIKDNAIHEYNYLNNDKYIYYVRESNILDTDYYKIENYEMRSAVAYFLLERQCGDKKVIVRKGTFV